MKPNPYESPRTGEGQLTARGISPRLIGGLSLLGLGFGLIGIVCMIADGITAIFDSRIAVLHYGSWAAGSASAVSFMLAVVGFAAFGVWGPHQNYPSH